MPGKQSGKKLSGQPGYPTDERALISLEDCRDVVTIISKWGERFGERFTNGDPEPLRRQVWEIRDIKQQFREYRTAAGEPHFAHQPTPSLVAGM